MKKLAVLTLLMLFFTAVLYAEEAGYKPTLEEKWGEQAYVSEAFFMYPGASAGLRFEMKLDDSLSAGGSIVYGFQGIAQSFGLRVEGFFYPQGHALNAWFVGPLAGVYNLNTQFSGPVFFSLGAQGGYRWIFDNITVAPRVLVQYGLGYDAMMKIRGGAAGFEYSAGVSAGWAF